MTDLAPFRERPRFLLCPRCGEMLDRAFDAVLVCLRCEGVWIAIVSLEKGFGDRRWPHGKNTWWRSAVPCPECASEGVETIMAATMADQVLVDRCPSHGLWLDRGELGRLMGGTRDDDGNNDLAILRASLKAVDADLDSLVMRRDAWRADVDSRRKSAAEYRGWLEAEQRRRTELEEAQRAEVALERARLEAEAARERVRLEAAAKLESERDQVEKARAAIEATAKRARDEAVKQAERARNAARLEYERSVQRLGDARMQASAYVARVETQIIMQRETLRASEAELEGARARLRAVEDQLSQTLLESNRLK